MIQCPYCQKNIPDDSLYCDQCGKKLNFCSQCHKPGSGRVCGNCGTPINGEMPKVAAAPNNAPQNPFAPKAAPANPFAAKCSPTPPVPPLKLQCSALAAPFAIQSGARFGRDIQPMNDREAFDTISSNHGVFLRTARGWTFKDVGSTNGTIRNGQPMQTNREEQLSDGDTLQMGEVIFKVILKQ